MFNITPENIGQVGSVSSDTFGGLMPILLLVFGVLFGVKILEFVVGLAKRGTDPHLEKRLKKYFPELPKKERKKLLKLAKERLKTKTYQKQREAVLKEAGLTEEDIREVLEPAEEL